MELDNILEARDQVVGLNIHPHHGAGRRIDERGHRRVTRQKPWQSTASLTPIVSMLSIAPTSRDLPGALHLASTSTSRAHLFTMLMRVRTGGAPGDLGNTLVSQTKRFLIFRVSKLSSTTTPMAAVPPG